MTHGLMIVNICANPFIYQEDPVPIHTFVLIVWPWTVGT